MTYQDAQVLSQLVAGALFFSLLVGVVFYAFRPGNKGRFEQASRLPLDDSDNPSQTR